MGDIIWARTEKEAINTSFTLGQFCRVQCRNGVFQLGKSSDVGTTNVIGIGSLESAQLTWLTVKISAMKSLGKEQVWDDLVFDPSQSNSLSSVFADEPTGRFQASQIPLMTNPSDSAPGTIPLFNFDD